MLRWTASNLAMPVASRSRCCGSRTVFEESWPRPTVLRGKQIRSFAIRTHKDKFGLNDEQRSRIQSQRSAKQMNSASDRVSAILQSAVKGKGRAEEGKDAGKDEDNLMGKGRKKRRKKSKRDAEAVNKAQDQDNAQVEVDPFERIAKELLRPLEDPRSGDKESGPDPRTLGKENSVIRRLQDQRKTWSWNAPKAEETSEKEKKYLFSDIEIPAERRQKAADELPSKGGPVAKATRSATELFTGDSIAERKSVAAKGTGGEQAFQTSYVPMDSFDGAKEDRWTTTIGGRITATDVEIEEVEPLRAMDVPRLAHGLDRVLFNPGVYWLRDPRSGIYNFDPQIRNLYDVDLFDYSALPAYQTSSVDEELAALTRKHRKRYSGSTSSLTSLLSHIYFFISAWKSPNLNDFTKGFEQMPKGFSFGAKLPANIYLRRFEEPADDDPSQTHVRYAIDNDKAAGGEAENSNYVLTQLGKSVEKLLTSSPEEYARYLRVNSHRITEEERNAKEAYYYSASDKFMMRSQLDCSDERLPRRTFDLKTRAVVAVRMDRANWVESSGYLLRSNTGVNESFERELWDMSRGTLLKYFFQARIGNMDGIMVAYHSTSTVFGFQYLSREELARRLFGSEEMGEQAYRLAIGMLEAILDQVTALFSDSTLRITMDAQANSIRRNPLLSVFVRGENDEDVLGEFQGEPRKTVLFRAKVDRYLIDALVEGPVDFNRPKGYDVDPTKEDEILRRERNNLPPLTWNVEWCLTPCTDMAEEETEQHLRGVVQRQKNVSALLLPNIEALNERELSRQQALRANPEAWQKFLDDRKSGRAAGMPVAPGQVALDERPSDVSWEEVGEAEGGDGKSSVRILRTKAEDTGEDSHDEQDVRVQDEDQGDSLEADAVDLGAVEEAGRDPPPHLQSGKVKWVQSNTQIKRLRQLAQLGQKDKNEWEKTDALEMYERRGD